MKKIRLTLSILLLVVFGVMCIFSACTPLSPDTSISSTTSTGSSSTGGSSSPDPTPDPDPTPEPDPAPIEIKVEYRTDYEPTTFDKSTVSYKIIEICDGLYIVENTLTKKDGNKVKVYAVEVDLTKVTIAAGTNNNVLSLSELETAVPYNQAKSYEEQTGKKVYAYLNADFFGSYPVNAFVKDGMLIKDGHNDNGVYDYKNEASDVPASAPMLFGVKGETAKVGPMKAYTGDPTDATVKQGIIKSKLVQKIAISGTNKIYDCALESDSVAGKIVLNKSNKARVCKKGDLALKVGTGQGLTRMRVTQVIKCNEDTTFTPEGNIAYVFVGANSGATNDFSSLQGKYISSYIKSEDGSWDEYTTILGCRQSLVENSQVAKTVSLENTNGAQSKDVPRSAVGVKADGKVVIFAVESLYYKNIAKEGDTHGMNLPQLADFMTYYGIKDGANFDGGGSTQLTAEIDGQKTVLVRSSDTGKSDLTSSRKVINTILVVQK